jgi:hypothetical protein
VIHAVDLEHEPGAVVLRDARERDGEIGRDVAGGGHGRCNLGTDGGAGARVGCTSLRFPGLMKAGRVDGWVGRGHDEVDVHVDLDVLVEPEVVPRGDPRRPRHVRQQGDAEVVRRTEPAVRRRRQAAEHDVIELGRCVGMQLRGGREAIGG